VTITPDKRYLYAVTEVGSENNPNGTVTGYVIDGQTGSLKFINTVPTKGGGPCHIAIDRTGKTLLVANYTTGSVIALSIQSGGTLGAQTAFVQHSGSSINPRQRSAHAHEVVLSPDERFLYVPDLGLDQVKIYRFDATRGTLTPADPAFGSVTPGSGPRHMAFGAGAKFAYVLCEMASAVHVFSRNASTGALTHLQAISTLPAGFTGEDNSAEIECDRSGRFLYASNRGHNSITVFRIDEGAGTLTTIQNISTEGNLPRNLKIDPTGRHLLAANQKSDNIVVFDIDAQSGKLTATKQVLKVSQPVCIQFLAI
jgi:6-phosphogluconolactonase